MLQAVMTKPGEIEYREKAIPDIGANEILLETKRIGICGSDIHVYHGMHPYTSYPVIQGHEVSGFAAVVGENVKGISVGDKITFAPQVTCGECFPCQNNMYHIYEKLKVMGFQTDGAGQEYFPVPAKNVFKLSDDFPLDYAAMIEPVSVAVRAVRKGGNMMGKKVLILGAGTIGNLNAQVAKALGADSVIITDIREYKLAKAKACGIDFTINSSIEDLGAGIIKYFGKNKADLILECVGVQATANQAIENARKGSTIVIVGVFGKKAKVDLGLVQDRELSLAGTLMYQKTDYKKAIELIENKKIKLDELLTHRFSFNEFLDAYQMIDKSDGHYMKVMIELD